MEKTARSVFWGILIALFTATVLTVAISATPTQAFATNSLTTASTKTSANPYTDVNSKTVDKTGIAAVKYIKAHKGYKGVINGTRFYPNKIMTQAEFTKILRNLYGSKVKLSTSKTAVTGKWACAQLQSVAKNVFGVKIKWTSGAATKKLTRVGASNYIKVFATWENGLFKPKQ